MPQVLTYEDAVAYIASLEGRGWRMGLDRMQAFCDRLGLQGSLGDGPKPKFIHVAGTNGKGSVTAFVQAILAEAGYLVGGYFSPYVYDIRERIQVQNHRIGQADFAELVSRMAPIADEFNDSELGQITEFELKTAMGFLHWKEMDCEWVACEVGLGGRLDATNVLTPACAVITSIGLDHTQLLGETHAEIAREKAGIIKPGVPVIVGDAPKGALETIEEIAQQNGSNVWALGREIFVESHTLSNPARSIRIEESTVHDPIKWQNALLAISAIDATGIHLDDSTVARAIENAKIPGRRQIHSFKGVDFVLDGAHNAESARALSQWVHNAFPARRVVLLTSMLTGHDPIHFYSELKDLSRHAVFTSIDFFRAIPPEALRYKLRNEFAESFAIADHYAAIDEATRLAGENGIVLVTGSFYLVGEIGCLIGANRDFDHG